MRVVNFHGRQVGGFDVDIFRQLTRGRYVSIPRSSLSRLIYRKIEGRHEVILGNSITGVEQTGDSVEVAFEHGSARRFDFVVGADGLHSKVRELAFGSEAAFEKSLGYTAAAFEVSGYRPNDQGVYVSYIVPGKQVGRFWLRDDRTLFLLIFATDQDARSQPHDVSARKALLRAEFDDIGLECPQILAALNGCNELYFDSVSQIRMDSWTRGRVTLLGDAAFCPSLLAGQGSALAMIAAYVLAGELGKDADLSLDGLQRYEQLLRPFMTAKQKAAAQFAGSFVPRTRMGVFLRNQITRAFASPFVAKLVLGGSLLDRIDLPEYRFPKTGTPLDARKPTG